MLFAKKNYTYNRFAIGIYVSFIGVYITSDVLGNT